MSTQHCRTGIDFSFLPSSVASGRYRFLRSSEGRLILAIGIALGLTACGDSQASMTGPEQEAAAPPTAQELRVDPSEATVAIGDTLDLEAVPVDASGREVSGYTIRWRSEDTTVAKVADDGRVVGTRDGDVAVFAEAVKTSGSNGPNLENSASVRVGPDKVKTVTVSPSEVTLAAGDSIEMDVVVQAANGDTLNRTPSWTSSDESVASVDASGTVTGLAGGSALVVATVDGVADTASVDVGDSTVTVTVQDISISPSSVTLGVGDTATLTATATSADGDTLDRTVSWSSSDESVATVDSEGTITGQGSGSVEITASADGIADTAAVSVEEIAVENVSVNPSSLSLVVGDTATLTATATSADGDTLDRTVSWSSSDESVATVDSEGLVTAQGSGSATITATVDGVTGSSSVSVESQETTTTSSGSTADPFRAFPEAQGYGAEALTTCDRSQVEVRRVTNLKDSGSGSLRDALENASSGVLSVVVFDVAGYIDIGPRINMTSSCVYVAGQTAPGDGVTVRVQGGTGILLKGSVSDVVFRHLRMRGGYHGDHRSHNNLIIGSGHDIVLDHMSLGWTTNYLLAIMKYDISWSRPVHHITVQRSLLHEVLAAHPTAAQITGHGDGNWQDISEIDLHHNLFAHNHHRNPANNTYGLRLTNNVIYNWLQGAAQNGQEAHLDAVANYFKPGPMADSRFDWEITWNCKTDPYQPSFYLSGNIGPHNDDPNADNWTGDSRMVACYYTTGDEIGQELPNWEQIKRTDPLPGASIPVHIQSASSAYQSVLDDVGANGRLKCDGSWTSNLDAVDRRVIAETKNGTGVSEAPETEADVGGFPSIDPGSACTDSDGDGMPDQYEDSMGLDAQNSADASVDSDGDGYTNLEEFLNGTLPG